MFQARVAHGASIRCKHTPLGRTSSRHHSLIHLPTGLEPELSQTLNPLGVAVCRRISKLSQTQADRALGPRTVCYCRSTGITTTWTPKVCKIMAFMPIILGLSYCFTYFWGFGSNHTQTSKKLSAADERMPHPSNKHKSGQSQLPGTARKYQFLIAMQTANNDPCSILQA